jgi:hypothetical protein
MLVRLTEIVLRGRVALVSGLTPPCHGLRVVLRHATAMSWSTALIMVSTFLPHIVVLRCILWLERLELVRRYLPPRQRRDLLPDANLVLFLATLAGRVTSNDRPPAPLVG